MLAYDYIMPFLYFFVESDSTENQNISAECALVVAIHHF